MKVDLPRYSHKIMVLSHGYLCYRHDLRGDLKPNGDFARKLVLHNEFGPASFNYRSMKKPAFHLDGAMVEFDVWVKRAKIDPELAVWYKLHYG